MSSVAGVVDPGAAVSDRGYNERRVAVSPPQRPLLSISSAFALKLPLVLRSDQNGLLILR